MRTQPIFKVKLFLIAACVLVSGGAYGADTAFEWLKNPLVVSVDGCNNFCVGVSRHSNFKADVIDASKSEADFVACEAVGDGTVCPSATDCRKVGFKLDSAQAQAVNLKAISEEATEKHAWVGSPKTFVPSGCARKLCGGADELAEGDTVSGYSSPVCEAASSNQCPSAVNCAYEKTAGTKLLRLSRVLEDGGSTRLPASVESPTFLIMLAK